MQNGKTSLGLNDDTTLIIGDVIDAAGWLLLRSASTANDNRGDRTDVTRRVWVWSMFPPIERLSVSGKELAGCFCRILAQTSLNNLPLGKEFEIGHVCLGNLLFFEVILFPSPVTNGKVVGFQ